MSLHTELALELKDQVIADLKQALAEKDREIAKWRRIRTPTHGICCTCQQCGLDYDACRCDWDDMCDDLDQLKKAYQQLMEKAIDLAKILMGASSEAEQYMTGEQFLQSPEVQAWKERQS